jgi:hypothetical protein
MHRMLAYFSVLPEYALMDKASGDIGSALNANIALSGEKN